MTDNLLENFDAIDGEIRSDQQQRLQASGLIASDRNPDQFARANTLADKHGAPVDVVHDNLPEYERKDRDSAFGALGMAHPELQGLMSDPRWRTLAQDDADGLGKLAGVIKAPQRTLLSKSIESLFGPLLGGQRGQALLRNADDVSNTIGAASRRTGNAVGEWISDRDRAIAAEEWGFDPMATRAENDRSIAATLSRTRQAERSRSGFAQAGATARADASAIQGSYPDGSPGYYAMGVANSVPLMAAAAVTRSPAVGGMLIGAGTAAEQRSSALADGATPGRATASGIVQGVLEGGMDTLTLGIAKYGIGPVKDALMKRFGSTVATRLLARASASAGGRVALAAAEGAATEVPTTVGQMASDQAILGTDYSPADYYRGIRDSIVQGGAMSGGMYIATSPIRAVAQSQDAELTRLLGVSDDMARLQAINEAGAGAKLAERSPPDLEAAAQAVAGDQRVHLSAEAARTLFQDDPGVLADMVGGQEALAEQLASGDLSIPMAKWATVVPRMANAEEIARHARLDPDGISAAEMERLDAESAKMFGDTAAAADRAQPAGPDPRQQIIDDVVGQLVSTNRYTPAQADAQAKLWGSAFSIFGKNSGQDPFALYQRYMAGISAGTTSADPRATRPFQGAARLDALIESVRNGGAADSAAMFGPSLTGWLKAQGGVQDQTGELKSFDAAKQRPGLVSRQGLTLDRARELAAEAGYLPADSTVADFLDAVDRDLRNGDVRSEKLGNAEQQSFALERQQLVDAMGSNPRLRDMPRAELEKLTNQQIADELLGSSLNQSAVPKESEIDRLRARVAELESELRTDRLTGMRNQRAFEEDEALGWETVGAADMDGLKRLNDAIGHEHADTVLRALGGILLNAEADGVRFYRRSGDEFAARFEDPAAADRIMREVQQRLENVAIDLDVADAAGNIRQLTYEGIGLAYGTGNDYQSADTAANASKRERLAAGIREDARSGGGPRRLQSRAGLESGRGAGAGQAPAVERGLFSRALDSVRSLFQSPAKDQTKTPEFKRWFGDSKIVDANGEPLVMYHVTDSVFTEFRDDRPIFVGFTESRATAAALGQGKTMALYVRAENPANTYETPVHFLDVSKAFKNAPESDAVYIKDEGGVSLAVRSKNQVKSATGNNGNFDPKNPSILKQQPAEKGNRGQISIFPDRRMSISLFERADASTFIHESAHFFFEVFRDLAQSKASAVPAGAPENLVALAKEAEGRGLRIEWMSPQQYLDLSPEMMPNAGKISRLKESMAAGESLRTLPSLSVEVNADGTGGVVAQDGRHRATILAESGIEQIPVVIGLSGERAKLTKFRGQDRETVYSINENPLAADFNAALKFMGYESSEHLAADSARVSAIMKAAEVARRDLTAAERAEITRLNEPLEKFARGFESYIGEGKAPSPELRSVFAKLASWILGVYRALRNLNVELTPEVRGVFDRMLASDDEIEAAQARQGMVPLALDAKEGAAIGLTEKQFADYMAMTEAAAEEARQSVRQQTLSALERERAAWWKEERAAVRQEVSDRYGATPAVRALRILSGRRSVDGVELEPPLAGLKLDKAAVVAGWKEDYLKRLGKTYARSGGVHPDEAAMLLGYASGDDLLVALANAPDTIARVESETDAIMRERHGDPMTDGTLAEKAMDAVHGSKRVQLLERELEILAKLAGEPAPNRRMLKAIADRRIAGKTPRQLRPNDYLVAERRAAREAVKTAARGDYAAALVAKRQQAVNVALYSAARAAQDQFDTNLRYLQRMVTSDRRARLGKAGHDYLEQVDGLLEALELKPVSAVEVGRRQRLVEWVHRQEQAGNPISVPLKLLADAGLTNVRDMTHEDIQGVVDTIKQVEHLAKTKTKLLLAGIERDREEVDAEMAASVLAAHARKPERTGDPLKLEKARKFISDIDIGRLLPANIARELDGYEEGGAVWSNVIRPIREAMYQRVIPAMHKMQEAVAGIYSKHYTPEELRRLDKPVWRETVGDHWSKGRILSLAMNWGSDGNREAILSQAMSRISEQQAVDLLRTLDARDWAFVQDVVDQVNSYWPEIAETQRRRTGLVPEKVEAKGFTITSEDGSVHVIRGGYFPLKYDAERSGYGATLNEIDDIYNDLRVGRSAKAATKNGHTIERVSSGGKTVDLGLDIAANHMRSVIRDIHLGDAVAYVHNTIHGSDFTKAAIGVGLRDHITALELWLKDVAAGELGPRGSVEKAIRFARQNTTAAVLTYKATSAMLQVTGLVQSGVVVGNYGIAKAAWNKQLLKGVVRLLGKSWRGPNTIWTEIGEKSAYMRERFGQVPDAVENVQSQRQGRAKAAHSAMLRWGYVPMARVQMIADAVTWLAGETAGLKKFDGDAEKARAFADDLVIRAQSPDNFIDKSSISRGTLDEKHRQSEIVKSTTMLLSYMIAKGNIAREKYQATSVTSPLQVAKFTVDMVQLFAVETIIMALVRNGLPDDEEDDGIADDWLWYLLKEVGLGSLATIPLLSQLATEGRGYTSQGVMERGWATLTDATGAWFDGELDRKDLKQAVLVSGTMAGVPSSQINTTADALWRVHDGEDVSPMDFLTRSDKPRE